MRRLFNVAVLLAVAMLGGLVVYAVPVPAVTVSSPGHLAPCFGNRGVEFGTFNAFLCEVKLGGDPSGALYFTPSVDEGLNHANPNGEMVWYKLHAAPNAYYVWENFSEAWGGSSPRSNGRIIALDEGPGGQCILDWPDWTVDPSGIWCVLDGGHTVLPERPLNATELFSVHEFQANMRAAVPLGYR